MRKNVYLIAIVTVLFTFGSYAQYTPEFVRILSGSENDEILSTCSDETGVYMAGGHQSDADLHGTPLQFLSDKDMVVAKYDHDGNLIWFREILGEGIEGVFDMELLNDNNLLIAGWFTSYELDFGDGWIIENSNQVSLPGGDSFVCKLNFETGDVEWIVNFGSAEGSQNTTRLSSDENGNIYLSGYYYADFVFDGVAIEYTQSTFGSDVFIFKLDESGNLIWHYTFGGEGFDFSKAIKTDSDGNVYVTGEYTGEIIIEGDTLQHEGDFYSTFLIKFDAEGNFVWSRYWGTELSEIPFDMMITQNDDIYILGQIEAEPLTIYGTTLISYGWSDALLVKFDVDGNMVWAKNFGGENPDKAYGIAQRNELIYITGTFASTEMYFDDNTIPGSDPIKTGIFLICVDENAEFQNYYTLFPSQEGLISGNYLSIYSDDAYVSGFFGGEVSFGDEWVYNAGEHTDGYLYKIDLDPNYTSIATQTDDSGINLYPNPSTDFLVIESVDKITSFELYDLNGKILISEKLNNHNSLIDLTDIKSGSYLLKIHFQDRIKTEKIVVY